MSGPDRRPAPPRPTGEPPPRWQRGLPLLLAGVLAGVLPAAGCTEAEEPVVTVQPGAPGQPGRMLQDGAPGSGQQPHTPADVRFMQAMIAHHDQALRMTGLVPDRSEWEDIALFARRIEIGQESEIALMTAWLEARNEATTGHDHGAGPMPGMLTEDQFGQLAAATGADFDRLFLELMIYHHEGALIMVQDVLASGGGQETEIFQILSHIDADQRIEIDRMRGLLAGPPG